MSQGMGTAWACHSLPHKRARTRPCLSGPEAARTPTRTRARPAQSPAPCPAAAEGFRGCEQVGACGGAAQGEVGDAALRIKHQMLHCALCPLKRPDPAAPTHTSPTRPTFAHFTAPCPPPCPSRSNPTCVRYGSLNSTLYASMSMMGGRLILEAALSGLASCRASCACCCSCSCRCAACTGIGAVVVVVVAGGFTG